jgi:hypothetical protein
MWTLQQQRAATVGRRRRLLELLLEVLFASADVAVRAEGARGLRR